MHKVVIVDDDGIICRGLCENVPWNSHGYVVVGSAADGEQGLEVIEKTKPDVVISDIRMPFMNGLEMAKIIKAKYPRMKVILLTGYEEFKYAQEALKIKAYDYILKPVDNDVLLETVKKAIWELENEMKVQRQIKESLPLLRQSFLQRLVNGAYKSEEQILAEFNFLELPICERTFTVLLIKADEYFTCNMNERLVEKELLKFCIYNICEEIFQAGNHGVVFNTGEDELVLIYNASSQQTIKGEVIQEIFSLAEEIKEKVEKYVKTTVSIGIGTTVERLIEIPKSYSEAVAAIEFRHIMGKNHVFYIQDTGFPVETGNIDMHKKVAGLMIKVKLGLVEDSLNTLNAIKSDFLQNGFISLGYVRLVAMEIIILLSEFIEESGEGWSEAINTYRLYNELQNIQTVNEIFDRITVLLNEITVQINIKRDKLQKCIVEEAAQYIKEHYWKEDLSLNEVSNYVHISPTYLSIIFKQRKNINYLDFVTEVKMKKAMELLRESDMKVYEVAEKVGYSNSQYFSVCFKKYTGFSPVEFKNLK